MNWNLSPACALASAGCCGFAATNDPPTAKPRTVADYDVWDGQLRYSGFKSTMLKFGVRNLFDRRYDLTRNFFGNRPSTADDLNVAAAGQPRTWTLTVSYAY